MVKEDEMPLKSYTIIHNDAKLTEAQKQMLLVWVDSARAELKAKSTIAMLP